ncbi:AraC family transcriptional regulator [Paenibacillus hemerocallicola]|uniref:AraC family transcriptional regulator n=1 Tax=Paenibacillus hemerocallicola TaxID=1172614 RepID=A0A5C4T723_9BACL|nr:AraC family transcriptional regulator [Paenibacillus hemerocallicola]TNJ64782.1 AraC family transcriptional regulator [Paenibacillus hemerocallicola]
MIAESSRQDESASFEELRFTLAHIARIKELGEDQQWLSPKRLEAHILLAVKQDDVQFAIDDRLLSLKKGTIFIGLPGQRIEYMGSTSSGTEDGYAIIFELQGSESVKDAALRMIGNESNCGIVSDAFAALFPDLCDTAYRHWHQPSKLSRLRSQATFYEIMYNVLYHASIAKDRGMHASLEMIRNYLDTHFGENVSIEQLAQRIGVSSRHFRRAFKQLYGISATDYVTDLRMSQAKRLMATTRQPIAEIARHVGYQDESHFRRTFKQQMGISPSIYVKNRQLKVAACSFPNIGQLLPISIIPFAAPIDHDWTDYYRRKYRTEVQFPLHHNNEINRKMLLAAKPDRIIAIDAYGSAEFQERLGEIAPTLIIPWRTKGWREHLLLTASFLNKTDEAMRWLAVYDEKADMMREVLDRIVRSEKLLVVMIDRHDCYRWTGEGDHGKRNRYDLPFAPERHKTYSDRSFEKVVPESLDSFGAERIILLLSEDRHSQLTWNSLLLSESWKKLKAVRQNRVHTMSVGPWFEYTAYNHGAILDQALKALNKVSACPK